MFVMNVLCSLSYTIRESSYKGEIAMSKHTKKGGSHNKQNSKQSPKSKTSGSQNGQNGYH
ncbi:hypothetical protein SAMN02745910_03880 [Priestia endophytica DSM 13796]|jgi:hypothetical protein|uniref:Uncharacterized protein n=1 Tax=Priestia endophytica DSM 13796 TaxID=1121089 RepID=A0A1I6BN01_9BACI|nr:hypothetical protein SAMN02745910_03880 [Priestia endophytica DSM 13796]